MSGGKRLLVWEDYVGHLLVLFWIRKSIAMLPKVAHNSFISQLLFTSLIRKIPPPECRWYKDMDGMIEEKLFMVIFLLGKYHSGSHSPVLSFHFFRLILWNRNAISLFRYSNSLNPRTSLNLMYQRSQMHLSRNYAIILSKTWPQPNKKMDFSWQRFLCSRSLWINLYPKLMESTFPGENWL